MSFADFLTLSKNFGQDLASYSEGNIDLQVGVAFAEFLILAGNFGMTPSDSIAVPEPIGVTSIWTGLVCMIAFRRRLGWPLDLDELQRFARRAAGRELTADEREKYELPTQ